MEKYITDIGDFETKEIGAKARNLFLMKQYGFRIPDLLCINWEFMKVIGTRGEKRLEEDMVKYIRHHFSGSRYVSVRSSCSLEDGTDYSFAGQFKTYLNVPVEDVFQYIVKCFESASLPNVVHYCSSNKIQATEIKMNVIIQEMAEADISGVVFTANPQGLLNEMVIVCGEGTGDAVVEDKVPVTSYYYSKTDELYYYETQHGSPVLDDDVFHALVKTVYEIIAIFGEYLDIEFAVKGKELYILQARPITALNLEKNIVLDNSNIVESYPGITLPLTFSFISEAYYQVFRGAAMRILNNRELVRACEDTLKEMIDMANGRVYYKISNWYTVLKFLPFSRGIIPVWQEMMGVSEKKYDGKEEKLSLQQRVKTYLNFFRETLRVPKGMKELNEQFISTNQFFRQSFHASLTNEELVQLYDRISDKLLVNWNITLLNDMYAFIFTGLLKRQLKKGIKDQADLETNQYISGITNIESMKPVKALVALADEVAGNAALKNELSDLKDDEAVAYYILTKRSDFVNRLNLYIENYGDRSLEELKLESATFRSNHILLIKKILEYTEDTDKIASLKKAFEREKAYELPLKGLIRLFSERAMLGIRNREISRLNRSRIYGMVRSIFLAIGGNFCRNSIIDDCRDIFYLNKEEVFDLIKGSGLDVRPLIEKRRAEYRIYENLPAYSRLIFEEKVFNKTHCNVNAVELCEDIRELAGIPCSNGIATGEVVVIYNPNDADNIRDKILVTKMTDPGWVFLLSMAKGIIAEKGSLLSHTAIISRELDIPSIVGVRNVTNVLKTGDIVTMNGSTGEIEIAGEKRCIEL